MNSQTAGENLLREFLSVTGLVWNRALVSGMTYNEAIVCNLLTHQMETDPQHPLTATDLCGMLHVRKSQMNQIVNSLEGQGYICRCRSESDRRHLLLALTEEGKAAYAASHQQATALLGAVVEQLGAEGTQQLTHQLQLVNNTLQEQITAQRQKGII